MVWAQPAWHPHGICHHHEEPALWWPERHETTRAIAAKQICLTCPVRIECLAQAIDEHEQCGIWGGASPTDRKRIRQRLRRMGWTYGTPAPHLLLAAATPRPAPAQLTLFSAA